jgi:protein AATF/BFR2
VTYSERPITYLRTHSHSIQTLNKWSLKIQAVAPAALLSAKRNAFRPTHNKGVVELVTDALAEGKLLERTRVRRTREKRIGDIAADGVVESANPEQDAEIFDDTDFYQQLLRDIIDDRAGKEGTCIVPHFTSH